MTRYWNLHFRPTGRLVPLSAACLMALIVTGRLVGLFIPLSPLINDLLSYGFLGCVATLALWCYLAGRAVPPLKRERLYLVFLLLSFGWSSTGGWAKPLWVILTFFWAWQLWEVRPLAAAERGSGEPRQ